jgi:hypothetical protein
VVNNNIFGTSFDTATMDAPGISRSFVQFNLGLIPSEAVITKVRTISDG